MVGFYLYEPVQKGVNMVEDIYVKMRSYESILEETTNGTLDRIANVFNEVNRLLGREVAEEKVRETIVTSPEEKALFDKLFEQNLALWISAATSVFVFSLYFNLVSFFLLLLKPFLFLVPGKR